MGDEERLRVNLICLAGFAIGVIALLLTDSGAWFLDVRFWGNIRFDWSFVDIHDYLFAIGSALVVIGVMTAFLSQLGGLMHLLGHGFLWMSLYGPRLSGEIEYQGIMVDELRFVDLLWDGLWLSFVACAVVIASCFVAVWYERGGKLRLQTNGQTRSTRLLAFLQSKPSGNLRINLVSVAGAVACGVLLFLPWFTVKNWTVFYDSYYFVSHQALISSLGTGGMVNGSGSDLYLVLALLTLCAMGLALVTTFAGLVQIAISSLFIANAYFNDVLGWKEYFMHSADEIFVGIGAYLMLACGAVILVSSWWRVELELSSSGHRVFTTKRHSFRAVRVV